MRHDKIYHHPKLIIGELHFGKKTIKSIQMK